MHFLGCRDVCTSDHHYFDIIFMCMACDERRSCPCYARTPKNLYKCVAHVCVTSLLCLLAISEHWEENMNFPIVASTIQTSIECLVVLITRLFKLEIVCPFLRHGTCNYVLRFQDCHIHNCCVDSRSFLKFARHVFVRIKCMYGENDDI